MLYYYILISGHGPSSLTGLSSPPFSRAKTLKTTATTKNSIDKIISFLLHLRRPFYLYLLD